VSPLLGERRGRPTYRILDKLSSGRGDDVFLTHHEIFDGKFVQKTVFMHGLEDALASNEPACLHRLDHPRIVPVREAQWDPNEDRAITFVMPHLAGGSVHDALLEGYRFSIYQSITITIDALDALGYVHREFGALHRDTKPGNVLLDEARQHGYLTDFGSAASMNTNGDAAAVLGTNVYRPPEARPLGRVGIDADLYGIAMTLFEMLNGRLPWEDLTLAEVEARLQKGFRAVPDRHLEFLPHVPERLRRVVRKGLQRDPGRRFGTAEEFIRALRRVSCIDWRHAEGTTSDGAWFGTWPPHRRSAQRTEYRVLARPLQAGPSKGYLRFEAHYRKPRGNWRHTVPDATLAPADSSGSSTFFATVEASAAHRDPAR
jgi:serine/threonine protein kinase